MFKAKTERIQELAEKHSDRIGELEGIFDAVSNVYIDFANVLRWQDKLGWHIDLKRLKQFLYSFDTIGSCKFYNGTLVGNRASEQLIKYAKDCRYEVITKPVKVLRLSLDVSSIPIDSPDILKEFIRKPLLQKFKIETIEFLNKQLQELNKNGVLYIEDLKCNFDVEIGRDMLIDYEKNGVENFILWSGDSDFADPVRQLLDDGKKVILFSTARRVSTELSELRNSGLFIFDIQKIKDFICWKKEMQSV